MNELKFALRQPFTNPGFTAVAVLTLALGIGLGESRGGKVALIKTREFGLTPLVLDLALTIDIARQNQ